MNSIAFASLFVGDTMTFMEEIVVFVGLISMLVIVLLIMQHPRAWATETPAQRSVNLALIGVVIALSSSLANLVQFQIGKVIEDPYIGMLAGGAVSGVLVALIAAIVDATRKRILLVSLLASIGFCILLWLHVSAQG